MVVHDKTKYYKVGFSLDPSGLHNNEWFTNTANYLGICSRKRLSRKQSNR